MQSYVLAQTTDSGSNNFTMATGVASIFRSTDSTEWDVKKNHHRCVCHVIALILGAGLKALQLSNGMIRPEKTDKYFPSLSAITEDNEEAEETQDEGDGGIVDVIDDGELSEDNDNDIDPDNAESASPEPGCEDEDLIDVDVEVCDTSGIGFTLKKVCYCFPQIQIHYTPHSFLTIDLVRLIKSAGGLHHRLRSKLNGSYGPPNLATRVVESSVGTESNGILRTIADSGLMKEGG
ncbi:hypothetical protein PGT21_017623 [Puccinia graminis f. sp. tritici]|uniref:Uncharacterized protein n=1 Tax=Puccinia graminis f. sp. tritici TaxID=56615 RepID=A0A5B0MVM5_PUCGR|nr:hypothetical protein PGT21_017623 [Puccinia graminis f. sp. tritici]KAA1092057.1 hypothetical protein PGTUg99_009169 [Puccinia graminis f. sp. tritici]